MLHDGSANPLSVHGLRELDRCPPHFVKVLFVLKTSHPKKITDWIWENFEGRFWFGEEYYVNDSGKVEFSSCAGFELPGEASMFALCLDQINSSNYHI
jgi:hypothetical protein